MLLRGCCIGLGVWLGGCGSSHSDDAVSPPATDSGTTSADASDASDASAPLLCLPWEGGTRVPSIDSDPALAPLHQAEQSLATAPHDPARSLDVVNASSGLCVIRGGAGLFFARLDFKTKAECQTKCASFAATNPNRSCVWRGTAIFGDPQQSCVVRGGAGESLSSLPSATESQCRAACDALQTNAYRTCDWGTQRIQHPARGVECRILSGAGTNVLTPLHFTSQADCAALCAQSTDPYRRCVYGNTTLQAPDPGSTCEILGGAGKVLAPVFHSSQADCVAKCGTFAASNPNRICVYGGTRLP